MRCGSDGAHMQRMVPSTQTHGQCLHTGWSKQHPHGFNRTLPEEDKENVRKMQREARIKCSAPPEKVGYLDKDTRCSKLP